jgi:hypothetical protein
MKSRAAALVKCEKIINAVQIILYRPSPSMGSLGLRKTFAIIGAWAVGALNIPLLANLVPLTVNAVMVGTGNWGYNAYEHPIRIQ